MKPLDDLNVPVKTEEGKTIYEPFNPKGQSDGSIYHIPKEMISRDHEHFFKYEEIGGRVAKCECGLGGMVFPHNAQLNNGHIYKLDGTKVI